MDIARLKKRFRFTAPLLHRLASYWSWWTAELTGMLPKKVRTTITPGPERLYLKPDGVEVIACRGTDGLSDPIARYPLTLADIRLEQAKEVGDLDGRAREVVLCLPADKVLLKTLTLPLAAEENLHEVLGFEMDRLTPFTADQVYYDHVLTARNSRKNTITLDLVITPRRVLDELLDQLGDIGFQPHQATLCRGTTGHPLAVNLLPAVDRPRRTDSARYINLALGVLALALLLGTIALPLVNKIQVIHALETRAALAASKAEVTRRLRQEVEQLGISSRFLAEKKQLTPLVLETINELTHILPDDTWINRLDIKGHEIQIQGESNSAAALIPLFESSDSLHNPRFRSPVTKTPNLDTERFHLSAEVARKPAS